MTDGVRRVHPSVLGPSPPSGGLPKLPPGVIDRSHGRAQIGRTPENMAHIKEQGLRAAEARRAREAERLKEARRTPPIERRVDNERLNSPPSTAAKSGFWQQFLKGLRGGLPGLVTAPFFPNPMDLVDELRERHRGGPTGNIDEIPTA